MTEEQRDSLLLSMVQKDEQRDELLSSIVQKGEQRYAFLLSRLESIENELESQRRNMAKMENNILDKISALFDAYEINSDKIKEHELRLNSVEHILDRHHSRLLKLETNN